MRTTDRPETRGALVRAATHRLESGGIEEARRQAEWMVMDLLGISRAQLYAYPEADVAPAAAAALDGMVTRRLDREPLQYILGHTEFYGLPLRVTSAVLIPRPETEQVVHRALQLVAGREAPRVLDVGTGSGCIALAIKHERPDADVVACDVSADALAVAAENAASLGLDVRLLRADALDERFAAEIPAPLDLLVSNPPYIADGEAEELEPEVRDHEPALALFAGEDPLRFYRALAVRADVLLRPGAFVVFETHADHAGAVGALLEEGGFVDVSVAVDLAGKPRIVTARRRPRP